MILMGLLHGYRPIAIGHCLVSIGILVQEGETWDSGNRGGVHSSPEVGGLRAHAELLKWGNIPESELCEV